MHILIWNVEKSTEFLCVICVWHFKCWSVYRAAILTRWVWRKFNYSTLKWLPFKNPRHCRSHKWMLKIEIRNFIEFELLQCVDNSTTKISLQTVLCMTFHFDNGHQFGALLKSMTINNTNNIVSKIWCALFNFKRRVLSVCWICDLIEKVFVTFQMEKKFNC